MEFLREEKGFIHRDVVCYYKRRKEEIDIKILDQFLAQGLILAPDCYFHGKEMREYDNNKELATYIEVDYRENV